MIIVTRLYKKKFLLNLPLVKHIESTPDTLITFINGDSIIVLESLEDIELAVIEFKGRTLEKAMKLLADTDA